MSTYRLLACASLLALCLTQTTEAGLVQYWPFDETVGVVAANSWPGGNTGVLTNFDLAKVNDGGSETPPSDWVSSGLPSQLAHSTGALDFEGGTTSGDYVDGGQINLLSNSGGGAATVSMWVKPNALNGDDRIYGQNGTTIPTSAQGATHVTAAGQVEIWDGAAWQVAVPSASPEKLAVGQWTHLAFVWTGDSVTTYADGVAQNTVTANFEFSGPGYELGIGNRFRSTHGTTFDGVIDDVSIYDHALLASAVADLFAGESPLASYIPEPSSGLLIALALIPLGRHARRRRTWRRKSVTRVNAS